MITAKEACMIAKDQNGYVEELKNIESYIKKAAMEGEYRVILYPSVKYHPKTIDELRNLGYRLCISYDYNDNHYQCIIIWGDEEE